MQKKLIALAVAGLASSAAFAQTNVVVYGVADGSYDYVWQSGSKLSSDTISVTTNPAGGVVATSASGYLANNDVSFSRVSANSSYFGFKGTEDLGNGLKAIFQYETGIDFTAGTGGASFASRDSFVGLSHAAAGTIVLGNLTGPTRALGAALDVNPGATGIGANSGLIGKIAGSTLKSTIATTVNTSAVNSFNANGFNPAASYAAGDLATANANLGYTCGKTSTCTSIFDTRWANAVAYLSPNWGGFSFAVAGVANENSTPDYGVVTPITAANTALQRNLDATRADTWGYDLGAKWEGMGFMAGVTYNWAQLGDWVDTEVSNLRVGGMYSTPVWSVRAMWEKTELDMNNLGGLNTDQQKFGLGGTFNIGKATLLAQWYGTNSAKDISNSKANLYEVGALYNLSKRTMLKATWAMIDNDDGSAADFGVNAIGNQSYSSASTVGRNTAGNFVASDTTTTSGFGAKNQGIQIGVRHSF
jgi:predicted porin